MASAVLLSDERLRELYAKMIGARLLAEQAQRAGRRKRAASAPSGREAMLAGALLHLGHGDAVAPGRNRLLARYLCGEHARELLDDIARKPKDEQRFATSAPIDAPWFLPPALGSSALELGAALGVAAANQRDRNERIVVCFLEMQRADEASAEALELAGARRLPILFVAWDGSQATYTPPGDAPLPIIPVERGDVIAVYRVAQESIRHARQGGGPTLMVCTRYQPRPAKPFARRADLAAADDPILNLQRRLAARGLWTEQWKRDLEAALVADETS